ncbi:uncharacterized protein [Equus przewalskii]|uniref:Uncharacterized protein isoform X2 n=1 Tax=Equus przewalskii TaxID=9798 RepID=A0ABM4LDI3_EQUPR
MGTTFSFVQKLRSALLDPDVNLSLQYLGAKLSLPISLPLATFLFSAFLSKTEKSVGKYFVSVVSSRPEESTGGRPDDAVVPWGRNWTALAPQYIVVYSSLWVLLVVACGMPPQRGLMSSAMSAPRIRTNETLSRLAVERENSTTWPRGQPLERSFYVKWMDEWTDGWVDGWTRATVIRRPGRVKKGLIDHKVLSNVKAGPG